MRSREEQIKVLAVSLMDEGGGKDASYAFAQEAIDAAIQRGRELERAEMEKRLLDPNTVHLNMLRGAIAIPCQEQLLHLRPGMGRDTARLDWLEKQRFPELRAFDDGFLVATDQTCRSSGISTARRAIDAAMNGENKA